MEKRRLGIRLDRLPDDEGIVIEGLNPSFLQLRLADLT
jgi:hypothetical protein